MMSGGNSCILGWKKCDTIVHWPATRPSFVSLEVCNESRCDSYFFKLRPGPDLVDATHAAMLPREWYVKEEVGSINNLEISPSVKHNK